MNQNPNLLSKSFRSSGLSTHTSLKPQLAQQYCVVLIVFNEDGDFAPLIVESGWISPGKRTISLAWHFGHSKFFIWTHPSWISYLALHRPNHTLVILSKTHQFGLLSEA
jgi:hypothetical protein